MANAKIEAIEGIGPSYGKKLISAGITTTDKLLAAGTTKKGRIKLAEDTGISEKLVLTWVNHADLFRINGVGPQYAELLEAAGVDTVPELSNRNAQNLFNKMREVNNQKRLVRLTPALKSVEKWILQAKELPRVIQY